MAIGACGPPAPPSPTESPPTAPTIRLGDWQATNGRWTFTAVVNPRGSATDVVLEYRLGRQATGEYNLFVEAESNLIDPGPVTVQLDLPDDTAFCARFTATNEVGSVSTEPRCFGALPSGLIVEPVPAGSASPPAAP